MCIAKDYMYNKNILIFHKGREAKDGALFAPNDKNLLVSCGIPARINELVHANGQVGLSAWLFPVNRTAEMRCIWTSNCT